MSFRLLAGSLAVGSLKAAAVGDQCAPNPCTSDESCCQDSLGYECCVKQSTFCVAPRGGFQTSTCCPNWSVSCTVGSVGCCDPARPWQFFGDAAANSTSVRRPTRLQKSPLVKDVSLPQASGGAVGYALFAGGAFYDGLSVLTIELETGNVTASKKVTGAAKEYYDHFYGESWRIVPWDAATNKFVFADQSYSDMSSTGKISVYTIDATTGESTGTAISGCTGYPLGMAWDVKQAQLVLGIHDSSNNAKFCGVDPSSGSAKDLGNIARGSDESSQDYYAAYISHAEDNQLVRVGHKQVSTGQSPLAMHTTLQAGAKASSEVWSAPLADSHSMPVSVQKHPSGGYISLAPKGDGSLDVVSWDGPSGKRQVVAPLTNANVPSSENMKFGYVADAVDATTYSALTVQYGPSVPLPGAQDKWSVASVDLKTGAATQNALNPQPSVLGAETIALCGFGMPATQASKVIV